MRIGVMSNEGVLFSSKPLLYQGDEKGSLKFKKNPYFQELLIYKAKLIKHDRHEKQMSFSDVMQTIKKLMDILQSSEKQSMLSFIYETDVELRQAQSILIDLGKHLLEFCDYINEFVRERYYKLLTLVLKRSELDLGQM